MTTEFTTPRLFISDYYDSLINRIDRYTEQLIEQYGENDILPNEPDELLLREYCDKDELCGEKYHQDTYSSKYNYDIVERQLNVEPGVTKVHEYINRVRSRQIDEILKVRDQNLEMYEQKKSEYKDIPNNMNEAEIEHLRRRLFANKFCFLEEINSGYYRKIKNNCFFKLYLVITDFYMAQTDKDTDTNK
jgi:hypothetical protein